jgi:hypothetical protein
MEKYLGVKLIEAEPMGSYAAQTESLKVGKFETGQSVDGYKVVYEDGYESWSPKDVFEKAYREIKGRDALTDKPILLDAPHKTRVFDECSQLSNKTIDLDDFIKGNGSNIYASLGKDEKARLNQQLLAMQYYLTILVERIENF